MAVRRRERVATAGADVAPVRAAAPVLTLVPATAEALALGRAGEPAALAAPDSSHALLTRLRIAAEVTAVHAAILALAIVTSQTHGPTPLPAGIEVALRLEPAPPEPAALPASAPEEPPAPETVAQAPAPAEPEPSLPAAPPDVEPLPESAVAPEIPPPPPSTAIAELAPEPPPPPVFENPVVKETPPPIPQRAPKRPVPARAAAPPQAPSVSETAASAAPVQTAMAMAIPTPSLPIVAPRPIAAMAGNLKPDYPLEARRRRLQGEVVLRVAVSIAGLPEGIAILSSSGHAVLDEAAMAAVRGWRFSPATRGGVPVPAPADVPVRFRLQD